MVIFDTVGRPGIPFAKLRMVIFDALGHPGTALGDPKEPKDALGPAKSSFCRVGVRFQEPSGHRCGARDATIPQFAGMQS